MLTGQVGWVEGIEGKGENILSIALLPQLGASVSVPQHYVVGGVDGQQQVPRGILSPQPVHI